MRRVWSERMTAFTEAGTGEGHDFDTLAERHGTPVHILDLATLRSNARALHDAWARLIVPMDVLYSVKTNYLPLVLQLLRDEVAGADVVSGYELRAALRAGFEPTAICFNGPMKTADEIEEAVRAGAVIHIDSPSDVDAIERVKPLGPVEVGLRVNPGHNVYGSPDATFEQVAAQKAARAKFGWPIGSPGLERLLERIRSSEALQLTRLHAHLGSQITDVDRMLRAVDTLFACGASLARAFPITTINIGGGFGVPGIYRRRHGPLHALRQLHGDSPPGQPRRGMELPDLVDGLNGALKRHRLDRMRLQCEPGRLLVSDAMSLLTRVVSVKEYGPEHGTWVILDGGLNLVPTAGPDEEHRFQLVGQRAEPGRSGPVSVMLGGPLCYEGDVFSYSIEFPRLPRAGELVLMHDTGAYTVSRATNFIRPRAPVVAVDACDGSAFLCWRRETDRDVFQFAVDRELDP
jgi:diaminopimelate decarboxylase